MLNPKKSVRNPKRSRKQNLLTRIGKSEFTFYSRSAKMSSRSSVRKTKSTSPVPKNIDQLDKTSPSTDTFISSRELRNRTECSRNTDALISPRQNLTATTSSVLLQSDSSNTKITQKDRSNLEEKRNARFASPPEGVPIRQARWHSKILKDTHTPSPEKRRVETDPASTPTKKMKKTPESENTNESYRSKLWCTADAPTLHISPTNIQTHEIKTYAQKEEESENLITPSVPRKGNGKITKSSSGETANDSCKSNIQAPSSVAIIVHKSSTSVQMQENKVGERNIGKSESDPEGKTLSLSSSLSTDLHSLVNYSNSDGLCVTEKLPEESIIHSNPSKDGSSINLDFELGKQKDAQSTSDASAEGMLPNLLSSEPLTLLNPTTIKDAFIISSNKDSVERNESLSVSDVLFEAVQPHLPEMQTETATLSLTGKTSTLILQLPSKPQNSTIEDGTAERNVGETESATEGKTLSLSGSLKTDVLSANHSISDDMCDAGNVHYLPVNSEESTVCLNVSKEASSTRLQFATSNLDLGKQKDAQSASEAADECRCPNLLPHEPLTVLDPTAITDAYFSPNKDSEEIKESMSISEEIFEVVQPHSPEIQLETVLLPLTYKMSSLNLQLSSKPQNSTAKDAESYIKSKKTQDSLSVSVKKTHSVSNELHSSIETQRLKYSQSKRLILNPHLPATPSNIFDSGIETKRMKPSQGSPKILNPHSLASCHSPRPSNLSIINIPRRMLTFESADEKEKIDENRSDSSTLASTPNKESRHYSKKSTSRSQRRLRRSTSDETLTSSNLPHIHPQCDKSNSLTESEPRKTSRNLRKITRDFNRAVCIVKPQFRRILPRLASNTTRNTPESWTQSGQSNQLLMRPAEYLPSNELPTVRNNPEVQILQNRNGEASTWRNQTMVGRSVINAPYIVYDEESSSPRHQNAITDNNPPYIDVYEGEASTSRHQPAITDGNRQFIMCVPEASTSNHQPSNTDSNPQDISVYVPDASTSRHQPLLIDRSFSGLVHFDSSISRNRPTENEINPPYINVLEEESTRSEYQTLTTDGSSIDSLDSSSDDSESVEDHVAMEVYTSSRANWLPAHVAEAHLLLQSVLREIILYNGDLEEWRDILALFRRLSQSSSRKARRRLHLDLLSYWGKVIQRSGGLWDLNQSMPINLFLRSTFEMLIRTVILTLNSTLCVYSSLNLDELIGGYEEFRRDYAEYCRFWENHNIEDIVDDATRLQLKSLKKITERFLLLTLTAFRLLLMYIGENAEERNLEVYEGKLAEEDKIYLKRGSL